MDDTDEMELVNLVADVIMENYQEAADSSHRPGDVRRLFIDANARYYLAQKIVEALP